MNPLSEYNDFFHIDGLGVWAVCAKLNAFHGIVGCTWGDEEYLRFFGEHMQALENVFDFNYWLPDEQNKNNPSSELRLVYDGVNENE